MKNGTNRKGTIFQLASNKPHQMAMGFLEGDMENP